MAKIFALFPGNIPGLETIQAVAQDNDHELILTDKLEKLPQVSHEPGVVLVGGQPKKLGAMISMIRSKAPRLSCLIAIAPEQLNQLPSDIIQQSDILLTSATSLEVQARLNAAQHISELRHLIESSAQIDEMTSLYNQPYFMKRLGEEIALSKRHLSPLTCIILEVSYYEVYLDSYGFSFVANLMRQVAEVVQANVRQEDIVARLGNQEIGFLLPRSSEKGAVPLLKRILSQVEELPIYMGDQVEHLHLNAGVAGYPLNDVEDMDSDSLVRYTRHALHHAKCMTERNIQLFSDIRPVLG